MGAEGTAKALELHLHSAELYSIQAARCSVKVPTFLKRNLSYVDVPSRRALLQQGSGRVLSLQLQAVDAGWHAAAPNGSAGGAPNGRPHSTAGAAAQDVIIAAVCVSLRQKGVQAFVPVSAHATLAPTRVQSASLSLQLPLGSTHLPSSGLSVMLIHQHSCHLASLLHLACRRRPGSAAVAASDIVTSGRSCGGKAVTACVTATSAFNLVANGSKVTYSIIPLDDVLGGAAAASGHANGHPNGHATGGAAPNGKHAPPQPPLQQHQGTLHRLEGILSTHDPAHVSNGATGGWTPPYPWIQFQQQLDTSAPAQRQGGGGASSARSSTQVQFRYCITLEPGSSCGSGGSVDGRGGGGGGGGGAAQQQQPPQQRWGGRAVQPAAVGGKRKASAAVCIDLPPPPPPPPPTAAAAAAAAAAEDPQQQGAAPPPPCQQQQQWPPRAGPCLRLGSGPGHPRPPHQPLLTFYFSSFDGSRAASAQARGFCCPLASCRDLRCHSYAGLQQHMRASHGYHQYFFSGLMPGGELEVYLRCKPAWCDPQGAFLPRQLALSSLESHPLSTLLTRTHIQRPFMYYCPRQQRRLRTAPGGQFPVDREEEQLEQEVEEQALARLVLEEAEGAAAAAAAGGAGKGCQGGAAPAAEEGAPSSSSPGGSSSMAAGATATVTATAATGSGGSGVTAAAASGATAAVAASGGSGGGGGGGAGGGISAPGGAAAAVATQHAASGKAAAARRNKMALVTARLAAAVATRVRGGRKAAVPVRRGGTGLSLLTPKGRPKFYHSRTCVAMTEQELLGAGGAVDSDSEGDLQEWKRDCQVRLEEHPELCPDEREFMFEWNLFVHLHPLHADADLPGAVRHFAAQHAERLRADGPFRRCLISYLLNLWRFRLLTPPQLHGLTASLPPLTAA